MFAAFMSILKSLGGSFVPVPADPGVRRHMGRAELATEMRAFQFRRTHGARSASQRSRSNRRKH
jgi:hypothetical protein